MAKPQAPPEYVNQSPATAGQLALWAQQVGVPADQVPTAVAIALAESGGKGAAVGGPNSDGSYDLGYWQINNKAHAGLLLQYPSWWEAPSNSRMMASVSGGGRNWRPWTTYTSGKYKEFLPAATAGAEAPADNTVQGETNTVLFGRLADIAEGIGETFVDLVNGVIQIAQGAFKMMVWMANPHNWVRTILVGLGGALLIGALVVLSKPNTTVVQAVTAAPKAAATAPVKAAAQLKKVV